MSWLRYGKWEGMKDNNTVQRDRRTLEHGFKKVKITHIPDKQKNMDKKRLKLPIFLIVQYSSWISSIVVLHCLSWEHAYRVCRVASASSEKDTFWIFWCVSATECSQWAQDLWGSCLCRIAASSSGSKAWILWSLMKITSSLKSRWTLNFLIIGTPVMQLYRLIFTMLK